MHQQDSMNGKPSYELLQIGQQHPSHDLVLSRLHQQDNINREPSCNLELSQNDQPSDAHINSETTVTSNFIYFILHPNIL